MLKFEKKVRRQKVNDISEQPVSPIFKSQTIPEESSWTAWHLTVRPIGCPKMSVICAASHPRRVKISQYGGSLKSCWVQKLHRTNNMQVNLTAADGVNVNWTEPALYTAKWHNFLLWWALMIHKNRTVNLYRLNMETISWGDVTCGPSWKIYFPLCHDVIKILCFYNNEIHIHITCFRCFHRCKRWWFTSIWIVQLWGVILFTDIL